ncbi:DUF3822 family protein [Mucilaginibacter sp. HMF5004]|uniref:DUF3822 family protein n=1 Tax=Mucilaginibacter rivuli TaxID=2857527 RepID=UPI001C5D4EA4|nr:DUF3822 family protein [Mucilaginibacter rivuli]MBW4891488.1 DUF3822 family protein [Mucilaginibacter rivuli]
MSNQRYNYYDPEFTLANVSHDSELLIMITGDYFSFTIIQKASKKVLVWGEQYKLQELKDPQELNEILLADFDSVKIGVLSQSFTIIHDDLYQDNKVADYARYLDTQAGDVVLVNKLDAHNHVIFKLDEALAQTIEQHFDLNMVFFAAKPWIAAVNIAKPYLQPLYVNIEGNTIQLYHIKDGKLDFYNNFRFNNADELMYYIVLTANELNINLDATSVILSGDITVSDKKIQRVSDLLPKVDFNQNQVVMLPSGFISHQILMLAGLTLCESLVVN